MARQKAFDERERLAQAMELFWERGYEATSVRDLMQHLDLSSSSLYSTFGDKHDLYLAALADYRRVELEQFRALLVAAPSARALLAEMFASLAAGQRGSFTLNAAVEMVPHDLEVTEQLKGHFDDITDLLADYLAQAQAGGEIHTRHSPRELARFFLNTLYSLAILAKIYPDPARMKGIARVALSVLDR